MFGLSKLVNTALELLSLLFPPKWYFET